MHSKNELQLFINSLPTQKSLNTVEIYPYEIDDLYFLYCLVREKSITSIMEFGSGWSTCVLALALYENLIEFGSDYKAIVRNPNPFQLVTIDASMNFLEIALKRIPESHRQLVTALNTKPLLIEYGGVLCHKFDRLPNFSPDLIYLDGPDHDQVVGELSGFKYLDSYTQPMSADIHTIEPFLLPETIIVTDGRTANARFLASRLTRQWQILEDPFGDRSTFRLNETPLGMISELHIQFRLNASRQLRNKELPNGLPTQNINHS